MLRVENLNFYYKKSRPVLTDVSFKAPAGKTTAILGNNGAGKTSLLKCIARILTPQSGRVLLNHKDGDKDILKAGHKDVAQKIAYLSQYPPSGETNVYEAVMLGRLPYIKWKSSGEDRDIVEDAINQLGLGHLAHRRTDTLSGGERQKVALARSIAQRAKVLLLDEPTSSLDLKNQHEVLHLISKLCKTNNIAAIMVIHDINLSLRFCTNFVLLKDNRVYARGNKDVVNTHNISSVYDMPVVRHKSGDETIFVPSI